VNITKGEKSVTEEQFTSHGENLSAPKPHLNLKPPVSSVQQMATNVSVQPNVVTGKVVMKVPVVLAETRVQIDLDTNIEFPEPVLEIKKIKKNLKVTQCRLLLPTNKLFIKGFVRKNIQYAAPKYGNRYGVTSVIKSLTVDVPFNVVTEVDFIHEPQFSVTPAVHKFSYFNTEKLPTGFPEKERLLSTDFSQFNEISEEVFNELPFCELLSSKFIEYDEILNRKMGEVWDGHRNRLEAPFEEGTFTKIEEKMVIELTLKVLQNQQVQMGGHEDSKHHED